MSSVLVQISLFPSMIGVQLMCTGAHSSGLICASMFAKSLAIDVRASDCRRWLSICLFGVVKGDVWMAVATMLQRRRQSRHKQT